MRFTFDPRGPLESSAIRIRCRARCVAPDLDQSVERLASSRATEHRIQCSISIGCEGCRRNVAVERGRGRSMPIAAAARDVGPPPPATAPQTTPMMHRAPTLRDRVPRPRFVLYRSDCEHVFALKRDERFVGR